MAEIDKFSFQFTRTMAVVHELSRGIVLTLPDGYKIAMGEDMSIGYVLTREDGTEVIGGMSTMDLRQLNSILEKSKISMIIPKIKR